MEEREFFWTFEAMGMNIELEHEVNAMGRVVFCGDDQFMFRLIFFSTLSIQYNPIKTFL